jgi:hypothetical protein
MKVVRHDRKGVDLPACPDDRGFECVHEAAYGAGIREDSCAVVSTGEHMIKRVGIFGARSSGHPARKHIKKGQNNGTYSLKEKGQATRW